MTSLANKDIISIILSYLKFEKQIERELENKCDYTLFILNGTMNKAILNISKLSAKKCGIVVTAHLYFSHKWSPAGDIITLNGIASIYKNKKTSVSDVNGDGVIIFPSYMYFIKIAECLEKIFNKNFIRVDFNEGGESTISVEIHFKNGRILVEEKIKTDRSTNAEILEDYFRQECEKNNIEIFNRGDNKTRELFDNKFNKGYLMDDIEKKNHEYFVVKE